VARSRQSVRSRPAPNIIMRPYILMIACGILLTAGDLFMKQWVVSKTWLPYVVGLAAYIVGVNFLAQSYLYRHIAIATVITNILNVVILSIVSWVVFKDCLTIKQIAGLTLAIVAIILLEI
jgi:multidrug transporter EmrE-like cation transporter